MNFIFVSPNFPERYYLWCEALRRRGVNVLGIGDTPYPCLRITLGGNDAFREPIVLDAEAYVAVKGFKAKGKRITTFAVSSVEELEPVRQPDADPAEDGSADPADAADSRPDVLLPDETREDIEDEIYGQGRLF